MDQPTVTAANVLSGQKTTRTVHFAITGDLELDLAAGIMAVLNQSGLYSTPIHRILSMLVDRFAGPRKAEEEFERQRIQGDLEAKSDPLKYTPIAERMGDWQQICQSVVAYENLQPPLHP